MASLTQENTIKSKLQQTLFEKLSVKNKKRFIKRNKDRVFDMLSSAIEQLPDNAHSQSKQEQLKLLLQIKFLAELAQSHEIVSLCESGIEGYKDQALDSTQDYWAYLVAYGEGRKGESAFKTNHEYDRYHKAITQLIGKKRKRKADRYEEVRDQLTVLQDALAEHAKAFPADSFNYLFLESLNNYNAANTILHSLLTKKDEMKTSDLKNHLNVIGQVASWAAAAQSYFKGLNSKRYMSHRKNSCAQKDFENVSKDVADVIDVLNTHPEYQRKLNVIDDIYNLERLMYGFSEYSDEEWYLNLFSFVGQQFNKYLNSEMLKDDHVLQYVSQLFSIYESLDKVAYESDSVKIECRQPAWKNKIYTELMIFLNAGIKPHEFLNSQYSDSIKTLFAFKNKLSPPIPYEFVTNLIGTRLREEQYKKSIGGSRLQFLNFVMNQIQDYVSPEQLCKEYVVEYLVYLTHILDQEKGSNFKFSDEWKNDICQKILDFLDKNMSLQKMLDESFQVIVKKLICIRKVLSEKNFSLEKNGLIVNDSLLKSISSIPSDYQPLDINELRYDPSHMEAFKNSLNKLKNGCDETLGLHHFIENEMSGSRITRLGGIEPKVYCVTNSRDEDVSVLLRVYATSIDMDNQCAIGKLREVAPDFVGKHYYIGGAFGEYDYCESSEFFAAGTLDDYIKSLNHDVNGSFNYDQKQMIFAHFKQLMTILSELHKKDAYFPDAKPSNFLFNKDPLKHADAKLVLSDLKSLNIFREGDRHPGLAYTFDYAAPEVIEASDDVHPFAQDYYACAMTFLEYLTGTTEKIAIEQYQPRDTFEGLFITTLLKILSLPPADRIDYAEFIVNQIDVFDSELLSDVTDYDCNENLVTLSLADMNVFGEFCQLDKLGLPDEVIRAMTGVDSANDNDTAEIFLSHMQKEIDMTLEDLGIYGDQQFASSCPNMYSLFAKNKTKGDDSGYVEQSEHVPIANKKLNTKDNLGKSYLTGNAFGVCLFNRNYLEGKLVRGQQPLVVINELVQYHLSQLNK